MSCDYNGDGRFIAETDNLITTNIMEYFYSNIITPNSACEQFITKLRNYANEHEKHIYLLDHPLINAKYEYDVKDVGIVLTREHKIAFVSFDEVGDETFSNYRVDVLEDIGSLSDTYNYKNLIGRVRTWEGNIVESFSHSDIDDIGIWLDSVRINDKSQYRRVELIITLFIGSINDISNKTLEISDNIIDCVKQKIQLFDSEQTQFIYDDFGSRKRVTVQGMSGTGKTELLLHKLREIYISNPNLPIGFTCHNRILASELKKRIPVFFNFMMVNRQIDWDKLLCVNAWGSSGYNKSGIYRYICSYYNLKFLNYLECKSFDIVCKKAIEELKSIDLDDNFAFSYILIDESQDFKDSFIDLCEMVTKEKIYIAGDIFQNIFEIKSDTATPPTLLLKNCYRTSPMTLMIAHALGLGLYEKKKLWWLKKEEWEQCGYIVEEGGSKVILSRHPLRRFDNDNDDISCFDIISAKNICEGIIEIIKQIKDEFAGITPEDIGVIFVDEENYIYDLSASLCKNIYNTFGWNPNIAYETKQKCHDTLFISNRNNVKGLEFPIVICVTKHIRSTIAYRNTLYTMLTRSFIRSYLLIEENDNNGMSDEIIKGIVETQQNKNIEIETPSSQEIDDMHKWYQEEKQHADESPEKMRERILDEFKIIDNKKRARIKEMINFNEIYDDEVLRSLIKAILKIEV